MPVRTPSPKDAARIAVLAHQLGYPSSEERVEVYLKDLKEDCEHAVFVAESESGSIIGWVHVFRTRRVFTGPFAEIGGLVVAEDCRGQGVGKSLLQAAEMWARERRCSIMRIRSSVIRVGAHAFYIGLGYTGTKSRKVFLKKLPEKPFT